MSARPPLFVVVVAAGLGARLGERTRKAGILLAGVPMVVRSMRALAEAPGAIGGAVVVHAEDVGRATGEWLPAAVGDFPWQVVVGGETRSESVARGLDAAPATATHFAVHDAARPLLHRDDCAAVIERVARAPQGEAPIDGAILAAPVTDTLKRVEGDRIVAPVDRAPLWGAQTPQVFTREALTRARSHGPLEGTDEASWLAAAGIEVRVVAAKHPNPKVTWPADLALCEVHLRAP